MMSELASRYAQIKRRIEALASPGHPVTLIAVSKKQPLELIQELYRLGHRDFGENYVQELVEKAEKLQEGDYPEIRWHFIGHLQTNKVKTLIPHVHAVHSVDSEKLALELAKRWTLLKGDGAAPLPCFIEVNMDQEPSKAGILPTEARALAARLSQENALAVQGLMAIPAANDDSAATQRSFAALRELELSCRPHTAGLLSMGMSSDFELAISEGATHVRVGTSLFGMRKVN